jgi:adenylate cyclase
MIFGVLGWFGMTYGILPHSSITSHALMFGNLGEMLVLSLGLAYKINILDKEKRRAELQAQEKERYHRLVKVLSHDVANSISIFSGYLRRLRRSHEAQTDVPTISKLEAVVENMKGILDLVRGEEALKSFQISASLKPVNLREVIQEVVAFYDEACTQKEVKLEVQIPENLCVMADKTALSNQVLSNVVSNAIKFSHPQSKISINVDIKNQCVHLKVRDFGVGILPEEVKRIFFSEEVTSKPGTLRERGSGLGASLVKDYMAIFKGRIEVNSIHESISSNCGTLITLVFPEIKG